MIHKTTVSRGSGPVARVTFTLPSSIWADAIYLVGDFNDWNPSSHPLRQDRTGTWRLSVELEVNRAYTFSYLCDRQWLTADHADGYIWDTDGRNLFLVVTHPDHPSAEQELDEIRDEIHQAALLELAQVEAGMTS
jgi:1,4-alpha-glucan branching enzyme